VDLALKSPSNFDFFIQHELAKMFGHRHKVTQKILGEMP
jgi:hypothetical protein